MGKEITVTAWNNGSHSSSGSGYGLRIPLKQRDAFFSRAWRFVVIHMPNGGTSVKVNVAKASFWEKCPELISREIGKWLLANGFAPWPKGHPPSFILRPVGDGEFELFVPGNAS